MSKFECAVVRIRSVEDHPNADRLSLNYIGGFCCISNRTPVGEHRYAAGDLVVYIPEGAIVPEWALRKYGYWNEEKNEGFLSGSKKNRVKIVKLRGVASQGLMFPVRGGQSEQWVELENGVASHEVAEGDDLAELLGVIKYEPQVPTAMAGQVCSVHGHELKWDIENIKKYPDVFTPGENVHVTEKCHGTFCCIAIIPGLDNPDLPGDWYVISKGLGAQGLAFKNIPENASNLYLRTVTQLGLIDKIKTHYAEQITAGTSVWVLGEVYGAGVQDLQYGQDNPTFAGFAIATRTNGERSFVDAQDLPGLFEAMQIPMVPLLYSGPFDRAIIDTLTDGRTTMGGSHIREGVVINPSVNRYDPIIGKVMLKSVSSDYLLRKGNTTEFN